MMQRIGLIAALAIGVSVSAISPASAQLARGCTGLPPAFPCPTARIMSFSVDKASIKPGESVILTWVAENPDVMTVTPTVGSVTARGSAKLAPAATTTYTLRVTGGANGEVLTKTVTVSVAGTTPVEAPAVEAAGTLQAVPRTADGKPKLQGVYNMFGMMGGRGGGPGGPGPGPGGPGGGAPGGRAGAPGQAPAPVAGQLPRQPTLKAGMEAYRMPPREQNVVVSDCTVGSVPPSIGPYSVQIIQNQDYVVILYEYMHLFRIVSMDGQPHAAGSSSWMGDSVGHWDGDTLVVDTIGFNTESTVGPGGDRHLPYKHSDELHMVERFRRVDYNTLEWETTLEDPKVFEGPWRTSTRLRFHPELKRVEEYQCNENVKNYDYLIDPTKEIKMNK